MTEFKIPELGENVASGDVTRVLVNVGDTITHDQPVVELETDKATIEVPSSVAGVVKEIKVKRGDKLKVGAVVLTVDAPARRSCRACSEGCGTGGRASHGTRNSAAAACRARSCSSTSGDWTNARRADACQACARSVLRNPPRP